MQLTETVTIINNSGKIITNGKHIVNIFKEAKAAYQDKKAALKAERTAAAAAEPRPGIRKAQTFDVRSTRGPDAQYYGYDHVFDVPDRRYFLPQEQAYTTHERYLVEDDSGRRRSVEDDRSQASSRRSHGSHRSRRSRATTNNGTAPGPPLTENNLRTLTEVSVTTPSRVPTAYRSPYAETAPRDMALSRPTLVHAPTAPVFSRTASDPSLCTTASKEEEKKKKKKKKDIDMNLAYGNIPPDLASRTDLGPATPAEEREAERQEEARKEEEARKLMNRIDTLLDEAECVQHTATNIIDHLQRKPEAAAAVALLLAELSTLLKTMSPGFLGIVKGGSPAVFALLASPQFLIGVGMAVGVTVIFFGGWKIVKRIKAAKALAAEKEASAQAFEMQDRPPLAGVRDSSAFQHEAGDAYGPPGPGSYDDALVLDDEFVLDEELSTIETWRRGIVPSGEDEESVDLELITPEAVRSVRGDAMSVRTSRTRRSSKSHRSHRSHRTHGDEGEDVGVPARSSSRAHTSAESEAGSDRSRRTSRSKTTARTETRAIEDGSRQEDGTLDAVLRPKEKKSSMLKTLFKKKREKEEGRESAVSVMA